jgi:hypothetical protein
MRFWVRHAGAQCHLGRVWVALFMVSMGLRQMASGTNGQKAQGFRAELYDLVSVRTAPQNHSRISDGLCLISIPQRQAFSAKG